MSSEFSTEAQIEFVTGQMNELASRLVFTEDERSLLLSRAALELHGEGVSERLEALRGKVGQRTSELIEGLIVNVDYWLSREPSDLDLKTKIGQIEEARRDDEWLRGLPL